MCDEQLLAFLGGALAPFSPPPQPAQRQLEQREKLMLECLVTYLLVM